MSDCEAQRVAAAPRRRLRSLRGLTLCGALAAALACGGRESSPEASVAEWRVDSTPLLTIGLTQGDSIEASFERITGATRRDDGQLIVADLGASPLKLFDAQGRFVRRLARRGGGPGEMEYLARLYRCGDRFFTFDIEGYRISEYSLEGEYQRAFRFEVPTGQQIPYVTACNASGRFAHLGWGFRGPPRAGIHRDTVPVWITTAADAAPTVVDSVPASERWGQTHDGQVVGSMPLPLGRQPAIAYGPNGFFISTGDAFEVRVYDTAGVALPPFRLADSVSAVTPADVRDFIEAEIAEDGERRRASIEREYGAITFPERHAAITALVTDREGLLWLRAFAPSSAASATWRILDLQGREVARVALPRRMEVFEIGRDYVLGREIDATEGVPVLRLLRLTRSSGGGE